MKPQGVVWLDMSDQWRDQMAGARMQVDQQFNDRILNSEFTNQQWGLIMTAVEFEIRNPEDPETAQLVANTENVPQILPELENLPQGTGGSPMAGGSDTGTSDGLFGRIQSLFGGTSSDVDEEQLDAATTLVDEYTRELQKHLQEQGQWASLCEAAARDSDEGDDETVDS